MLEALGYFAGLGEYFLRKFLVKPLYRQILVAYLSFYSLMNLSDALSSPC